MNLKHNDTGGLQVIKASKMTGKLSGLGSINCSPIHNDFCEKMSKVEGTTCKICYSRRSLKSYRKNADKRFVKNQDILRSKAKYLVVENLTQDIVRFNSHGELLGKRHFLNYLRICVANPNKIFTLWTKRDSIVRSVLKKCSKPKNLILVYSSLYINKQEMRPHYFDKVFTVYDKSYDDKFILEKINCSGDCLDCLVCYTKGNRQIYINERRK